MTDTVAIISPDRDFRQTAHESLDARGLKVIEMDRTRTGLPRAQTIFLDIQLLKPGEAVPVAVKARSVGAELVLVSHWSRRARLERLTARARVEGVVYPIEPTELLRHFVVNPFSVEPDPDPDRLVMVSIAGMVYGAEGVAVEDTAEFARIVRHRMSELMLSSLEDYHERAATDRAELSALAALLGRRPALFQPYGLFEAVQQELIGELPAGSRLLSASRDPVHDALSLALLIAFRAGATERITVHAASEAPIDLRLPQESLAHVPREFRELVAEALELGETPLRERLARVLTGEPGGDAFSIVLARSLASERGPAELATVMRRLAANGVLMLEPGETLLQPEVPLEPIKLGPITAWRRAGPAP